MASEMNVPKVRVPGFTGAWEQRKLGDICQRVTRKNKNGESDLPLTISSQDGLIDQRNFFGKVVAAKDMSNYYLLKNGEFAYNKSYSKGYDYGSIKRLNAYEMGCLSTLYICFALSDSTVDSDYLEHYFDTLLWYKDIAQICAEGARNHGLLNVDTKAFFDSTYINVPKSLEEQKMIAAFLATLDNTITLHQRKCDGLEVLKKGMLQKMFPREGEVVPEIRFPGFTNAWEQRKFGDLCSIVTKQTGFDYTETIKKSLVTEASDDTLPYLQTKNFTGTSIDYNTDYYIPKSVAKEFPKINLDEKCILFSIVGASVGNIGLFPGEKHCFLSGAICVSKLLEQDDADYLYHFMCSESGQSQIRNRTKGGAQATVTIEDIRSFNVLLPNKEERTKIGRCLSSIDNLITLHQCKCDELKELKKGLMQQMFV